MRNKDKPWVDDESRHSFDLKRKANLLRTRDLSWVNYEGSVD